MAGMHGGHGFGTDGAGAVTGADMAAAQGGSGMDGTPGVDVQGPKEAAPAATGRTAGQVLFDAIRGAVVGAITGGPAGAVVGGGMGAAGVRGPVDMAISFADRNLGTNIGPSMASIGRGLDKSLSIGPLGNPDANQMAGTPAIDTEGTRAAAPQDFAGLDPYRAPSPPQAMQPPAPMTVAPALQRTGLLDQGALEAMRGAQAGRGLLTPAERFTPAYYDPAQGRILNR